MKRLGLLAAALIAVAPPARAASDFSSGASPGARASIDFSIVVPRVMQLQLLAHPAALDISADDVARGTITVNGAQLAILVNDPLGYTLRARIVNAVFSAATIVGLPGPLVATAESATLRMATMVGRPKPQPVSVQYQLQLAPDAQPGHYAWPVAITLEQP